MRWKTQTPWKKRLAPNRTLWAALVLATPWVEAGALGNLPGWSFGMEAILEGTTVLDGGTHESASTREWLLLEGRWDLEATLADGWGALGWQWIHINPERGGSKDAGDLQAYTNLESERSLDTLYECWWEGHFFQDTLRLKAGKIDANSEFLYVESAGEFAHSSAGFSPTVFPLPSYPEAAFGLNLFARLYQKGEREFTLGYGVYDGAATVDGIPLGSRGPSTFFSSDRSDDRFHILEGVWHGEGNRLALAAWYHNGHFPRTDGAMEGGTHGWNAVYEQVLMSRDRYQLTGFVQYGWAEAAVSEVHRHLAAGLVSQGVIAARPEDTLGMYCTWADLSDAPGAAFSDDEWAIDATYRWKLNAHFYLQPEIQYIINPSGRRDLDNALLGGLRFGFQL